MLKILLLTLLFPLISLAQLSINPAPVSGFIDLDTTSATIYFTNTSTTPVVMSLALTPKAGFSMPINRCAGKTLSRNQNCYVTISVNDSLLSNGVNTTTFMQNGVLQFTLQRTKIQGSGSSIFPQAPSVAYNDFLPRNIIIQNLTPGIKNYNPVLSGPDASKFTITLNRCSNVGIGKTCAITVKLNPQSAGSYSAVMSDPLVTGTINLTSTITVATPGVIVPAVVSVSTNPSSLNFGTITQIGQSTQNLTITNNGNVPTSPVISVAGTGLVISLNRCLILLGVGQSCSVSISFNAASDMDNGPQAGLSVSVKASSSSSESLLPVSVNLNIVPVLLVGNPLTLGNKLSSIGAGDLHSCYVDVTDHVKCWGRNNEQQSLVDVHYSGGALSGKTVKTVSVGGFNACAIANDDKVYCWGRSSRGENGGGSYGSNLTQVYWGGVLAGKTAKFLSTGYQHSCIIASDDKAYCWGENQTGQLGNGEALGLGGAYLPHSNIPVAVDMTGVLAGKTLKFIAAGGVSTCAIANDNKAYCWGGNGSGQLGRVGATTSLPVAVDMTGALAGKTIKMLSLGNGYGSGHTCAVASDNKMYCWGLNDNGQLGNGVTTNSAVPVAVSTSGLLSGKTIKSAFVSTNKSCAMDSLANIYCWGNNNRGTLGDRTTSNSLSPVAVDMSGILSGMTAKSISLGASHTCLLTTTDDAYCWGFNFFGQLGDGTTSDSINPVLVNQ